MGERLSLWALKNDYGKKDLEDSGPLYKAMKQEGNKIRISFDDANGLLAKDGELKEFTIAGDDENFVDAKAVIERNTVLVWSDAVAKPAAVRFAWKNVPFPNLFNKADLPASPFRTDSWKLTTEGKKLMTKIVLIGSVVCLALMSNSYAQQNDMRWTSKVGAAAPRSTGKIFNTANYGAVNDTTVVNTVAIQKTIDACAAKGGGIVVFKPGNYVSGSLFIKSNVQLRIDKGVTLLGSQNFDDYPEIDTPYCRY